MSHLTILQLKTYKKNFFKIVVYVSKKIKQLFFLKDYYYFSIQVLLATIRRVYQKKKIYDRFYIYGSVYELSNFYTFFLLQILRIYLYYLSLCIE